MSGEQTPARPVTSHDEVRAWIGARRDEIVKLLCDMIAIDSVTGREGPLAAFCADWLQRHGIEAILQPAKDRANALGVVGQGAPALLISGHLDTVPPNEGAWTYGPFQPTVAHDRVWGLGASDLHASIVGAYFAQLFVLEQGIELPGRLITAFTIEEETTGDGTQLFLDWAGREGFLDFGQTEAIVTEPTGLEFVCLGNRGSSFVVLQVTGLGGHGSRPHLARNPVDKLTEILAGLRDLQYRWKEQHSDPDFGHTTLTTTSIVSGDLDRTNVIPEEARAVIDCRPTPAVYADDLAIFRRDLRACITAFEEEGFEISFEELYPREGHKLDRDHPLAQRVLSVLRDDLGVRDADFRTTPAGNDAVFLALKGIPTINKVGPGHPECAHRVDEFVSLDNLYRGVELFIWSALRQFSLLGP